MYLICNNSLFISELAQNKEVPNQLLLLDILVVSLCHHSRGLLPPVLVGSGWFGWVEDRESEKSFFPGKKSGQHCTKYTDPPNFHKTPGLCFEAWHNTFCCWWAI